MNLLKKILEVLRGLFRSGLDRFLADNIDEAKELLQRLVDVRTGQGLHEWYDEAFGLFKARFDTLKDNWVAILIHLAYEQIKASVEKR